MEKWECGLRWDPDPRAPFTPIFRRTDMGGGIMRTEVVAEVYDEADAEKIAALPELVEALGNLVDVIDDAGLMRLSNGVQLGANAWYAKAHSRMAAARKVLLPYVCPSSAPTE